MPFQITDLFNMSEYGLVTDIPSNNTPPTAWNDSLDVRPKDGSVQGVYDFVDSFAINDLYNGGSIDAKPVAVTQWTPAGSRFLNIAYVIESQRTGEVGRGRVFVYNTQTSATVDITSTSASNSFLIDLEYPPQLFVFNEVLIMNPGTGVPQYISADATTSGQLVILPGFAELAGTSVPRVMRAFKNRLIALNWYDDQGDTDPTNDTFQPIDFVWSSNITNIGSLDGATWQAATTNTAGDAFLTATPGRILDGVQLGEDFMVYKSDSVVRVHETGDSLVLGFQSLLEDDGAYHTGCIANIGNSQHFVVGNYGIYIHDGRGDKQDIAKGIFQEALFSSVDPARRDLSFVFQQTRDKEVWFCFSTVGNTGGGCDEAFVYDYNAKKVHRRTLPNVLDLYETEVNGQLRIFGASPDTKQILELSADTYVADGYFTILDKDLSGSSASLDVTALLINASEDLKIALIGAYFLKETKDYSDERTFNTAGDYKLDVRTNGRYLSMRVTMDGVKNPKLTTIAFNIRIAGKR